MSAVAFEHRLQITQLFKLNSFFLFFSNTVHVHALLCTYVQLTVKRVFFKILFYYKFTRVIKL